MFSNNKPAIVFGGHEADRRLFACYHAWREGSFTIVSIKSILQDFFKFHPRLYSPGGIEIVIVDGFNNQRLSELEDAATKDILSGVRDGVQYSASNPKYVFLSTTKPVGNLINWDLFDITEERLK